MEPHTLVDALRGFAQLGLQGLTLGAIYSLVALGLLLVWRATGIVNFAQGDLLLVAAFLAWWLLTAVQLPFWLALVATVLLISVLCAALDVGLLRRIAGQPHTSGVLLTLGIGAMLRGGTSLVFGPETRAYTTPWSGTDHHLAGLVAGELQLVILLVCMAMLVALYAWLEHTESGIAAQGMAQSRVVAQLGGVPVRALTSRVFAAAGGIAALGGVLLAPLTLVDMNIRHVFFKGLAAVVVGGAGGAPGVVAGGVFIGTAEQWATRYLPDGTADIVSPIVLIAVLACRPRGLFAQKPR